MDVRDDQVHGNQEGAFFNTYYKGVCYAPLYIFCGPHLLVAKLRSSNVDPAEGALEELQRIIGIIREKWKETYIFGFFGLCYAMSFSIRDETLIEKDIDAIFVNCFRSRTN
jgi:hypothetical protein